MDKSIIEIYNATKDQYDKYPYGHHKDKIKIQLEEMERKYPFVITKTIEAKKQLYT